MDNLYSFLFQFAAEHGYKDEEDVLNDYCLELLSTLKPTGEYPFRIRASEIVLLTFA